MQHFTGHQPLDPTATFIPETASQTAGPYVHIGLALAVAGLPEREHEIGNRMARPDAAGQSIRVHGLVLDGNDAPVDDLLVEAWQADAQGHYVTDFAFDRPFNSFGRTAPENTRTGERGWWTFDTVKPGRVAYPDGRVMAPHINLMLFARGINIHLHTRMYFDDEDAANRACPVLSRVPEFRRSTLVARHRDRAGDGAPAYEFVIHLQGPKETVFFDF